MSRWRQGERARCLADPSADEPGDGIPTLELDPFAREHLVDPHPLHRHLRDAGPLVWLPRWGIYGMAHHANVIAALRNWRSFTSERGVGLSDFAKEAPWRPKSALLETGVHQCLGQLIARQEAEVLLTALLARVSTLRRTGDIVRQANNTLFAMASLQLEIEPG